MLKKRDKGDKKVGVLDIRVNAHESMIQKYGLHKICIKWPNLKDFNFLVLNSLPMSQ